jgi:predicted ATPase
LIESIQLFNFKCFERQEIRFRQLTLFAGLNSSGKSTVIQSLLLLRQSYLEGLLPNVGLTLNGKLAQLGTAKDVLFEDAEADEIRFGLDDSGGSSLRLALKYEQESDILALKHSSPDGEVWGTSLFRDDFQYLKAERVGPRTAFQTSDYEVRHHRQIGAGGEFATHFVCLFGREPVRLERLRHPSATGASLQSNVEAWMSEISPGVRLTFNSYSNLDLVTLGVGYGRERQVASSYYRPTNVGFGITYALPIVVAVLAAKVGDLVVIENPEAHLHPRGQVRMGEFLAMAATAGAQVVTETHSDHILNGIRLAVHDEKARATDMALYHSQWLAGRRSPSLELLSMDDEGKLKAWPEGFFDEIERSLDRLLGGHEE